MLVNWKDKTSINPDKIGFHYFNIHKFTRKRNVGIERLTFRKLLKLG